MRLSSNEITYARSFLRALSAFSLWMCSIRMRLFLNTLPLALRYKLWYLDREMQFSVKLNEFRIEKKQKKQEPALTCACRSFWNPGNGGGDGAGCACVASRSASRAYGRWRYPSAYLQAEESEFTVSFEGCFIVGKLLYGIVKSHLQVSSMMEMRQQKKKKRAHRSPCDVLCGVPACSCGSGHGNALSQASWWSGHPSLACGFAGLSCCVVLEELRWHE